MSKLPLTAEQLHWMTTKGYVLDARGTTTGEPNPCVRTFGAGPAGAICKTCGNLYAHQPGNKVFYKCDLRAHTGGPGSDHRVRWNACSRYEERKTNAETKGS